MARMTAAEVAQKWAQRAGAAQADYTAGVNRVTEAPGQAAANAADVWQARLQDPQVLAKFKRKVSAVSLEQWKSAAANYGAARYAQGVSSKTAKFEAAMAPLLSYIDSGLAQIKSMPNVTLEDRIQRSAAWQRYMNKYQGTG